MVKIATAALALALALTFGQAKAQVTENNLQITVQDISRKDGVWPEFSTSAESGPLLPKWLSGELDPSLPENAGAVWRFSRHITVSPMTRITISFTPSKRRLVVAYGTIMIGRNGENYDDYAQAVDAGMNRITLVLTNPKDTPALAEYHWKYATVGPVAP